MALTFVRRLRQLLLNRIDLVDEPANPGARVVLTKRAARASRAEPATRVGIVKADAARRLVYGWGSVVVADGEPVVDRQGDVIDADTLDRAVEQFMLDSRDSGVMHEGRPVGKVVASLVTTPDLMTAFFGDAIDVDGVPVGWLLAIKVLDDAAWQAVLDGRLRAFSIQGTAEPSTVTTTTARKREGDMAETAFRERAYKVIEKRATTLQAMDPRLRGLTTAQAIAKAMREDGIAKDMVDVYQDASLPADAPNDGQTMADNPSGLDGPSRQMMLAAMKAFHGKLGDALDKFGNLSALPADHPAHSLKAIQQDLGAKIANRAWMDDALADTSTGNDGGDVAKRGGSAWQEIERLAVQKVAKSAAPISLVKAINAVMQDKANWALVTNYYAESHGRVPFRDPSADPAARR